MFSFPDGIGCSRLTQCLFIHTYILLRLIGDISGPILSVQHINNINSMGKTTESFWWAVILSIHLSRPLLVKNFTRITSASDIRVPIYRPCVYVGARVACCPSEQETLKVVPNLLGYTITISYLILHKVTSEVTRLTWHISCKLFGLLSSEKVIDPRFQNRYVEEHIFSQESESNNSKKQSAHTKVSYSSIFTWYHYCDQTEDEIFGVLPREMIKTDAKATIFRQGNL